MKASSDYQTRIEAESKKWGSHLKIEADADVLGDNWLGHPAISEHYYQRGLLDWGVAWPGWIREHLSGPAERSLDLGCGTADRSLEVFKAGATRYIEGIDISPERLAEASTRLSEKGIPGSFRQEDVNSVQLPANTYDLIFAYHSFHHFVELEKIMEQVHQALTPNGLFVLEEFIGPTQFQWTDLQIELVRAILRFLPEDLRMYRMGWAKKFEGRPKPEEVMAASPFESIRSADILPLFKRYFHIVRVRQLGGTLQHLLYNGIIHNFIRNRDSAAPYVEAVYKLEDTLMDFCLIPSDFMLLIGKRKDVPQYEPARFVPETKDETISYLGTELASRSAAIIHLEPELASRAERLELLEASLAKKQGELDKITKSLGWRLLSRYGKVKYSYLLPLLRKFGIGHQ